MQNTFLYRTDTACASRRVYIEWNTAYIQNEVIINRFIAYVPADVLLTSNFVVEKYRHKEQRAHTLNWSMMTCVEKEQLGEH